MRARIGIDVGGTFTKAVLLDGESGRLFRKVTVPTTHDADTGVARGVVQAFRHVLTDSDVSPGDVELVVLSTTQAVNALLEGDVATVGVVALGRAEEQRQVIKRTRMDRIRLSPDKDLRLLHRFLASEDASDPSKVEQALLTLVEAGAEAVVASGAFSVEDPSDEIRVLEAARRLELPATAGHEMSGLYGLEVRTVTAAVNASILPKMARTITWVEHSMRETGLSAPLMVMHGDLEVTGLTEARRRPVSTVLSGPAASVAGALLYHRVLHGLFVEVGGTSTNVGVVRNGRPASKYVSIMDHPTCLKSVDVRVAGVAGGSLVRVRRGKLSDVGPRSAHIAGLPYPSFVDPTRLRDLRLVTIAPRSGDSPDYAVVESASGERFALTLTDAANALGIVPAGDYALGRRESARRALEPLAEYLGVSVDEAASRMLDLAASKVLPTIKELREEYKLGDCPLLGLGGGASVLVPWLAKRLGMPHQVVPNAEVISSIGVAMAPVGVELERSLGQYDPELLSRWMREAERAAVAAGADPETVRVTVEPVPERSAVRLRAVGSAYARRDGWTSLDAEAARGLAARALGQAPSSIALIYENAHFRVFQGEIVKRLGPFRRVRRPIAVVDREGAVLFTASDGSWQCYNWSDIDSCKLPVGDGKGSLLSSPPRVAVLWGGNLLDLPLGMSGQLREVVRSLRPTDASEPILVLAGSSSDAR
mgnify:FL=1